MMSNIGSTYARISMVYEAYAESLLQSVEALEINLRRSRLDRYEMVFLHQFQVSGYVSSYYVSMPAFSDTEEAYREFSKDGYLWHASTVI